MRVTHDVKFTIERFVHLWIEQISPPRKVHRVGESDAGMGRGMNQWGWREIESRKIIDISPLFPFTKTK